MPEYVYLFDEQRRRESRCKSQSRDNEAREDVRVVSEELIAKDARVLCSWSFKCATYIEISDPQERMQNGYSPKSGPRKIPKFPAKAK